MNTLTNTTDLSMVEIVTMLGEDNLNKAPSDASKARVAPVMFADGRPVLVLDAQMDGLDIYDLLETVTPDDNVNHYAVITTGWAAPIGDDDTAPSKHPERRRVELLCAVSRDGVMASAMAMEGSDELITDDGGAQGSLALAVLSIFG